MKTLISVETLKADLKCAWESSGIERMDQSERKRYLWFYSIDDESWDCLMDILKKSDRRYTLSTLAYAILNNHTILPSTIDGNILSNELNLK